MMSAGQHNRLIAFFQVSPWRGALLLSVFCLTLYLPGFFTLPPLDRDEARFAQASVQMLESGQYLDIRFQDTPRYKKPPGAYWLQAAALKIFNSETRQIWIHRLPSLLAALGGVWLLFFLARPLIGQAPAALAAALLGASILLVSEAHQAKTDALLLFCAIGAQMALCRIWLLHARETKTAGSTLSACSSTAGMAALFWGAQAGAILLKGPVLPFISLSTILALGVTTRQWRWLKNLYPLAGFICLGLLLVPIAIAMERATGGTFASQALSQDFLPKLLSGQESHGAPPGYYVLLAFFTFWPASLFLIPACICAWRSRRDGLYFFLLAWIVPSWLVFELIPTKLPHYVLPLYPALAIATSLFLTTGIPEFVSLCRTRLSRLGSFIWLMPSLILGVGMALLPFYFDERPSLFVWVLAPLVIALAAWAFGAFWQGKKGQAAWLALAAAIPAYAMVLQCVLPQIKALNLSSRAIGLLSQAEILHSTLPVAAVGYHEPSLVYLAGTRTQLVSADEAATLMTKRKISGVLIAGGDIEAFQQALGREGEVAFASSSVSGLNYSRGDQVTLHLFLPGNGPTVTW